LAATPGVQQNHGFVAGQVVVISGCPIAGYNGIFPIVNTGGNFFSYFNPISGLAPTNVGVVTTTTDLTYLAGNIGQSGGANGLIKLGSGSLLLSGNSTFAGQVDVNGGSLGFTSS